MLIPYFYSKGKHFSGKIAAGGSAACSYHAFMKKGEFLWMVSKKYPLGAPYLKKGEFLWMVSKKYPPGAPYLK